MRLIARLWSSRSAPKSADPAPTPASPASGDGSSTSMTVGDAPTTLPATEIPTSSVVEPPLPPATPVQGAGHVRIAAPISQTGALAGSAVALRAAQTQTQSLDALARTVTLERLTTGRAFDQIEAADLVAALGAKITREGLTALYASCLPGATPVLTSVECRADGHFSYIVSWYDGAGREVARAGRDLHKREDGSLDLHQHTVWVSPAVRGRGVSAKAIVQERAMLRALSTHPGSTITLRAGSMFDVDSKARTQERVGSYAWALFGFDFADAHDLGLFLQYGSRVEGETRAQRALSTRDLVRACFMEWVDAVMAAGALPHDAELRAALAEAAAAFEHPWEIASFHVDGVTVPVGPDGAQRQVHLGKAFLMSERSPSWDGVLFVNRSDRSAEVSEAYCARTLDIASQAEAGQQSGWRAALASDELERVRDAVEEVGRLGDASWLGTLAKVGARHPKLAATVEAARRRLAGPAEIVRSLRERALDPQQRFDERVTALQASLTLSGEPIDWGFYSRVVRDPAVHPVVARSTVEALMRLDGLSDNVLQIFAGSHDVPDTLARMSEPLVQLLERFTEPTDPLGAAARRDLERRRDEADAEYERLRKQLDAARARAPDGSSGVSKGGA